MTHLRFARSFVSAAVFLGVLAAQAEAEETKLSVALIGLTASNWSGFVAKEKGFFKDQGLDVEWISTGQSSKAAQSVMAGAAPMGSSSMLDTIRAIYAGGNLLIFANSLARGIHELVATKDIKSVSDLKGKRVIVGGQKDITAVWWDAMARHYNLDPNKDVEVVYAGATSARMSALESRGVAAAALAPPASFKAIDDGNRDLGPMAKYLGDFPMMIYHVNKTWAERNHDKVVAFVKAEDEAARYILDPKNRHEVSEILARVSHTGINDALRTYDLVMKVHGIVADSSIPEDAVHKVVDALATNGDLKNSPERSLSTLYDPQYVKAVK